MALTHEARGNRLGAERLRGRAADRLAAFASSYENGGAIPLNVSPDIGVD